MVMTILEIKNIQINTHIKKITFKFSNETK